ncbi:MAG: sigma-70 family RNA polymerase sigma factor [Clostridia bacterium]|nr:sigma-70 family RNA polymerase sigma factor [Clostridia bacterium]
MNKVLICGIDTSKLPRATNDELINLLKEIKIGNEEAREQFIMYNMRLVLSLCGRFNTTKNNVDDVFQVGMVGLIKAMDNFDLDVGVRFSTYAVPMILGEIKRFLRDNTSLKVTRSLRDIAYRALSAKEMLGKDGDEPTLDKIAEEVGVPVSEVACALDAISDPISIYENVYSDEDGGLMVVEQLKSSTNEDSWLEQTTLKEALKTLGTREQQILQLRYFVGKTQTEISDEIGISQAQVSRLEKNAIKILRLTTS